MKNLMQDGKARQSSGRFGTLVPVLSLLAPKVIGEDKPVDVALGMTLLRDKRVPVLPKMLALLGGIGGVALFDLLELPLEMVLAVLLPLVGFSINLAVDGLQYLLGSVLIAAAVLPYFAPKSLVEQVRRERRGPIPVTVSTE